jgi:hypothetical protein
MCDAWAMEAVMELFLWVLFGLVLMGIVLAVD